MNLLEIGARCANKEQCAGRKSAGGAGLGLRVESREPAAAVVWSGRPLTHFVCARISR
jgi:hypothetical protein